MNLEILAQLEALKKAANDLAASLPKMMEEQYNKFSPKDKAEYIKAMEENKIDEKLKDISEVLKKINNPDVKND